MSMSSLPLQEGERVREFVSESVEWCWWQPLGSIHIKSIMVFEERTQLRLHSTWGFYGGGRRQLLGTWA